MDGGPRAGVAEKSAIRVMIGVSEKTEELYT